MKILRSILFALLFLAYAGCKEGLTPELRSVPHYTHQLARVVPENADVLRARVEGLTGYNVKVQRILRMSRHADDARLQLRALIADAPEALRADVEQMAAAGMLYAFYFGEAPLSQREAVAAGEEVDRLVALHNPDATVIARALDRLEGTWSAERRHEAATRTLAAMEASRRTCTDCEDPLDALGQRLRPDGAAQIQRDQTVRDEGAEALRRHLIATAAE